MAYNFVFFLGLAIGSFLNVLIDRLPKGENVLWGRSKCDYCGKILRWFELIPLLSFLLQQGRCLRCYKKLSFQYPLVELATGLGFVVIFIFHWSDWSNWSDWIIPLLAYSIIFSSLLVIFVADFKYQIIPDSMIVFGILGAVLPLLYKGLTFSPFLPFLYSALGAIVFFLFLYFVTRGRGIGFGDVKFSFFMGFLLGYPKIVIALYVAFLTGALVGVILILGKKKGLKSIVPFGPFLIAGTIVSLIWGDKILSLWRVFF